jgi:hypothetical protein
MLSLLSALIGVGSVLAAERVSIGDTAELYREGASKPTRGILVARSELAPCGARSRAEDIHFDAHERVEKAKRPCPGLPLSVGNVAPFLFQGASLADLKKPSTYWANQERSPNPNFITIRP